MTDFSNVLTNEEKIQLKLRKLYDGFGYKCFKMNKFEEYDLYGQNKNFLVSDGLITFTDTDGKLMALKPDVTLSIVKNYIPENTEVTRLFYDESVYRISKNANRYKEISQTGLECLGNLSEYNVLEVVCLAALSLKEISSEAVLNISLLDVVSEAIDEAGERKSDILNCISEKNASGAAQICEGIGLSAEKTAIIRAISGSGDFEEVSNKLKAITRNETILNALISLKKTVELCSKITGVRINAELSLISDLNFYNGLVMQGFIKGIPSPVLSGGGYDGLMKKLGKKGRGFGFAVYLDLLERFNAEERADSDVLLLIGEKACPEKVLKRINELNAEGLSVTALGSVPAGASFFRTEKID